MYFLYPEPKKCNILVGELRLSSNIILSVNDIIKEDCLKYEFDYSKNTKAIFDSFTTSELSVILHVNYAKMHKEGYTLDINCNGITINCESSAGLFYSLQTLNQIVEQSNGHLPYASISDEPSLNTRGIMLDIGRDKIPTLNTLYHLLDMFSHMRINHVQLYMEGFCYDYSEYRYLFADETPMTSSDFKSLVQYANQRFIDLVPNQNVLGHMEKWLDKPQFNSLAECEDGFIAENMFWRPPMTLDVSCDDSIQLATNLLDSLLGNFTSEYVNINMDEPFELGRGKNEELAKEHGRLKLYLDYMHKLNTYCKTKGKKMLMWGDEILENPECVSQLPKDVTLLDWIYEGDARFEDHAKLMQKTGLKFCLCPGTSSWGSITGRSDNMKQNIADAVNCSISYGGQGIITTDWGDLGHWQYISTSYPGFAYTGLYAWSGVTEDDSLIEWYCNHYIYKDSKGFAFRTAYDLGNYYHFEHATLYNTTLSFAVMSTKYYFDSIEEFDLKMERMLKLSANIAKTNHIQKKEALINIDYNGLELYLTDLFSRINQLQLECNEGALIKEEMLNGLQMIHHGVHLYQAMKEFRNDPLLFQSAMVKLFNDLDSIMKKHYTLWISRNRSGGFSRSSSQMLHLLKFYRKMSKQ